LAVLVVNGNERFGMVFYVWTGYETGSGGLDLGLVFMQEHVAPAGGPHFRGRCQGSGLGSACIPSGYDGL
jgi:hypothetical protein